MTELSDLKSETPETMTSLDKQEKLEKLYRRLENEEKEKKGGWKSLLWAIIIALGIRSLLFEPYNIPSSSMVPNLLVGDYLFITKFDYGYSRHSFPLSVPLIPYGRMFYTEPKQGDVVIFKKPPEDKTDYIKRIIGMPGDTVQMIGGRLYINNRIIERIEKGKETYKTENGEFLYTRYTETLPNGIQHDIYELGDNYRFDDTPAIVVPPDHFLMMGDNRDNSLDGRSFGVVPYENLEGKARIIFYSTNGQGWFFQFWKWPQFIRKERIFSEIK